MNTSRKWTTIDIKDVNEKIIELDFSAGTDIDDVIDCAIALINDCKDLKMKAVMFNFNNVIIHVYPDSKKEKLHNEFIKKLNGKKTEYRNSDEYKEQEKERLIKLKKTQAEIDKLMSELPTAFILFHRDNLMQWFKAFSSIADDRDLNWDRELFKDTLESAGYKKSAFVGHEGKLNRSSMASYIIGQALSALENNLPPHPSLTCKFVDEYFIMSNV